MSVEELDDEEHRQDRKEQKREKIECCVHELIVPSDPNVKHFLWRISHSFGVFGRGRAQSVCLPEKRQRPNPSNESDRSRSFNSQIC